MTARSRRTPRGRGGRLQRQAEPGSRTARYPQTGRPTHCRRRSGRRHGGSAAAIPWGAGLYSGTFLELSLEHGDGAASLVASGVFHGPAVRTLLDQLLDVSAAATADADQPISSLHTRASEAPGADDASHPRDAPQLVDLRGFAVDPTRIEAALGDCRGVASVSVVLGDDGLGGRRLIARVVPAGADPPTLDELRAHLWRRLPGYAWPADLEIVGRTRSDAVSEPSRERAVLSALWAEAGGGERAIQSGNHWQVSTFVDALAEARRSGVGIDSRMVMRNRTVHALAADLAAAEASA